MYSQKRTLCAAPHKHTYINYIHSQTHDYINSPFVYIYTTIILNILREFPYLIDLSSLFARIWDPFRPNPFLLFPAQTSPQKIGRHMKCTRTAKMHRVAPAFPVCVRVFYLKMNWNYLKQYYYNARFVVVTRGGTIAGNLFYLVFIKWIGTKLVMFYVTATFFLFRLNFQWIEIYYKMILNELCLP